MARRRSVAVATPSRFSPVFFLRLLKTLLVLVVILFVVLAAVGGLLTYRVVTTKNLVENVTPESAFQSNYENLNFNDLKGGEHEGWLLVGLKGAPVIILCHGYDSNRSDILSLGTFLRQNYFNVYLFNFEGRKAKRSFSDLGPGETDIVLAAIGKITAHDGINPNRVGLYGVTTGAFAALAAGEQSPLVKALVVDNAYEHPRQAFQSEVADILGRPSSFFRVISNAEFGILTYRTKVPPVRENLAKLHDMPKLFIAGGDMPALAETTRTLYGLAPEPKRMLVLEHSQSSLASGAEMKEYENQVLTFFLQNLPLRAD
jgi:esterase/lipase